MLRQGLQRFRHDHLEPAKTKVNIATVLQQQGELQQALDKYHEALPVLETTLGRNHPFVADTKNNIALVYENEAKYPEALQMHKEVLEVRLKIFGPDHPDVADTKNKCTCFFFTRSVQFIH